MRYLKGSRVEVMDRRDSPLMSWRCAEILAGNGHTYSVRYDDCCSPKMVERVPRKSIRPCPPSVKAATCWAPGDVVEVFEEGFWKPAILSAAVGGDYFLVRLLGSCEEFRVHTSRLRVRQAWQNERWVVIQKNPGKCDDEIIDNHPDIGKSVLGMPRLCLDMKKSGGKRRFPDAVVARYDDNRLVSSRSMKKRSRHDLLLVNACDAASRKMRAVEVDGGRQQRTAWHPSYLPKKVKVGGLKSLPQFQDNRGMLPMLYFGQFSDMSHMAAEALLNQGGRIFLLCFPTLSIMVQLQGSIFPMDYIFICYWINEYCAISRAQAQDL